MADEKWISGLHGAMPIHEAARRALSVRLGVVGEHLSKATGETGDDTEPVHQLRVGTRRAAAALRIFAEQLPDGLLRKTRKTLRRLRRAAGAARDWDVFLEMLHRRSVRSGAQQRRGFDFLQGFALGRRTIAQADLAQETARLDAKLERQLTKMEAALSTPPAERTRLRDLAEPVLTKLLQDFEAATSGDLQAYDALHQVRILGKQIRYAMEVFESCFARPFREEIYPSIAQMQEILGQANDSHVALGRLNELAERLQRVQPRQWRAVRPAFEALTRYHQRRLPTQRRRFLRWLELWRKADTADTLASLFSADQ